MTRFIILAFLCFAEFGAATEDLNFNLKLYICDDYFEIMAKGGSFKMFYKEEDINHAYDELKETLAKIHDKYNNFPDTNKIVIVIEKDRLSSEAGKSKLMNAAKKAVEAGFFEVTGIEITKTTGIDITYERNLARSKEMDEILRKVPGLKLYERKTIYW